MEKEAGQINVWKGERAGATVECGGRWRQTVLLRDVIGCGATEPLHLRIFAFWSRRLPKRLGKADCSGQSALGSASSWSLNLPHTLAEGGCRGEIANTKKRKLAPAGALQSVMNGRAKGYKSGGLGCACIVTGGAPRRACRGRFTVLTCP